jgi:hypothetical protein
MNAMPDDQFNPLSIPNMAIWMDASKPFVLKNGYAVPLSAVISVPEALNTGDILEFETALQEALSRGDTSVVTRWGEFSIHRPNT